jgi:hypothetical protein
MADQPIRASGQEQDSAVDALLDAFTEGRLTAGELKERIAAASVATARSEPAADLPVRPRRLRRHRLRRHRLRRRRPYDRVLPVLFVLILVSAIAGAPALAAALSVVFISMLACRIAYGGRW